MKVRKDGDSLNSAIAAKVLLKGNIITIDFKGKNPITLNKRAKKEGPLYLRRKDKVYTRHAGGQLTKNFLRTLQGVDDCENLSIDTHGLVMQMRIALVSFDGAGEEIKKAIKCLYPGRRIKFNMVVEES